VKKGSRFWNVSGVKADVSLSGAKVELESLPRWLMAPLPSTLRTHHSQRPRMMSTVFTKISPIASAAC
jgi:hypothetical protein